MKHYRIKLLCVLGISLAVYSAVSIGIAMTIVPLKHLEDLDVVLPGACYYCLSHFGCAIWPGIRAAGKKSVPGLFFGRGQACSS